MRNHPTGLNFPDDPLRVVEIVSVIRVVTVHGKGIEDDPVREVTRYFDLEESRLLATNDPCSPQVEKP